MDDNHYDLVYEIVRRWHQGLSGEPLFSYYGIDLGEVVFANIYKKMIPVLKQSTQSSSHLVALVKRFGVDGQIRFASGLIGDQHKNEMLSVGPQKCVAVYDIRNNAVIDAVISVSRSLMSRGVCVVPVVSDPSLKRRAVGSVPPVYYSSLYRVFDERETAKAWKNIEPRIQEGLDNLKSLANDRGIKIFENKTIKYFIKNSIRQSLRDVRAFRKLYRFIKPDFAIMGADAFPLGKITSFIGRRFGFGTLVIQHGAPILPYFYAPVHADFAAVWGKASAEFFENYGADPEKLIITGNPRFDYKMRNKNEKTKNPKLILLTNPLGKEINDRLMARMLPVFDNFEREVVIKTHPSEQSSYYRKFLKDNRVFNVKVVSGVDLSAVVNCGDIVVTMNSSAGVEALILGASLHIVEMRGVHNTIPYHMVNSVKIIAEEDSLLCSIVGTLKAGGIFDDDGGISRFLEYYVGPLDGAASDRIAEFVTGRM